LGGWWRARGNEGYDPLTSKSRGEWRGRFGYRTARIFSYSYVVDMTMHCGGKSAKPISSRVIRFKKNGKPMCMSIGNGSWIFICIGANHFPTILSGNPERSFDEITRLGG
jgi:hypothetical protein